MELVEKQYCYVCGFNLSQVHPLKIKLGTTCPCCVYEYGIDDTTYGHNSFTVYRNEWILKGLPFEGTFSETATGWSLEIATKQLLNLKEVILEDYFLMHTINDNPDWTSNIDFGEVEKHWHLARIR